MRRPLWTVLLAALLAAVAAAQAQAHIEVLPATAEQGVAVEFTIRVPTERELPTTAVEVTFPSQVTVFSFADPPPGWRVQPITAANGRLSGVRYTGGRIGVERYADFRLLGTPFEAGTAPWKTRQTHADGQVKPWTGPPEKEGEESTETGPTDPGPAAAVEIVPEGTPTTTAAAAPSSNGDDSGAGIWLGVIAIAISALAALGVGLLWSTRPARLPEDKK